MAYQVSFTLFDLPRLAINALSFGVVTGNASLLGNFLNDPTFGGTYITTTTSFLYLSPC